MKGQPQWARSVCTTKDITITLPISISTGYFGVGMTIITPGAYRIGIGALGPTQTVFRCLNAESNAAGSSIDCNVLIIGI